MGHGAEAVSGNVTAARAPFHILIKPIGPLCNLDCSYCFYLEKKTLYPDSRSFHMSAEVLEAFTRQYIESQPQDAPEVNFAWQGGEPTLLKLDFFRRAVRLQKRYARPGLRVSNSLQTNGTLLDDDWGKFLKDENFLVGLSLDGPEKMHDRYRRDKRGQGSFKKVMRGLEVLKRHEVEFNTLTVVQADNANHPGAVYDFLEASGSRFFQFIPIVEHTRTEFRVQSSAFKVEPSKRGTQNAERGTPPLAAGIRISDRSAKPAQWGHFLNGIFDRWLEVNDVGRIFVQLFDMMLGLVMGYPASLCVHAETCGRAAALEHNGDLYSCDHFVHPDYRLGNIRAREGPTLTAMVDGTRQQQFGRDKRDAPRYCRECKFRRYCYGACPKDRIALTPDGEEGLHYLCAGYRMFYAHTLPYWEKMAACLRQGRPASDWNSVQSSEFKVQGKGGKARNSERRTPNSGRGRNSPCPCGSGRKFKKCCERK